jgi:diketogulonate reductase-like aldo/keto reductase
MEECVEKGLIKHIGVSNFLPFHLQILDKTARLPVEVTQLEIHPNFQQRETVDYCRKRGMDIMAWSPLFKGQAVKLPEIGRLAEKYGKTPAQIILRWDIQNGITPVVSSTNAERIKSNFEVFDFAIDEPDMQIINALESGEHVDVFSYVRQQESLKGVK